MGKKPLILHLETATEICSVSLSSGTELIAKEEIANGFSHAENLLPLAEKVLKSCTLQAQELDAIALSEGPGSYTGLRIGASTAKGLCYALEIPLIAISTLESIARGAQKEISEGNALLCPMIDARRMEVFTTLYTANFEQKEEIRAEVVDENSFQNILAENHVIFCGNGMPKCQKLLQKSPNAIFSFAPLSSCNMIIPALQKFEEKQFEDVAYFEPFYLKNYIAKKSTVKGLYD